MISHHFLLFSAYKVSLLKLFFFFFFAPISSSCACHSSVVSSLSGSNTILTKTIPLISCPPTFLFVLPPRLLYRNHVQIHTLMFGAYTLTEFLLKQPDKTVYMHLSLSTRIQTYFSFPFVSLLCCRIRCLSERLFQFVSRKHVPTSYTMAHEASSIKKLGNSRVKIVCKLHHRKHKMKYLLALSITILKLKTLHFKVFNITVHSKFKIVFLIQLQI